MHNEINNCITFDINDELLLIKNSIHKQDKLFWGDEIFSVTKYEYTVEETSTDFFEICLFRDDIIHAENERQMLYCNSFRLYMPRMYLLSVDISDIDNINITLDVFEKQNRGNSLGLSHMYSRIEDSVWTHEENIPSEIYNYLHDVVAENALKEILEERKQ